MLFYLTATLIRRLHRGRICSLIKLYYSAFLVMALLWFQSNQWGQQPLIYSYFNNLFQTIPLRNSTRGRIVKQKGGNKETSSGHESFFIMRQNSKAHFALFYHFPCSINIAFWLIFNFRLETSAYLVLGWWHCIYLVFSSIVRSSAKKSLPRLCWIKYRWVKISMYIHPDYQRYISSVPWNNHLIFHVFFFSVLFWSNEFL